MADRPAGHTAARRLADAMRRLRTPRAGIAAAYREAAGITNPYQGVSPEPHHGNPELENMRQETIRDLEIPR